MAKIPSLTGKVKREPAPAQPPAAPVTWMRVTEDKQVPRAGGSYMLRSGKELPSSSYDFVALRRSGVKLEPCEAPQWFLDAQVAAIKRYEELVEAGVEGLSDPTAPDGREAALS